MKKLYTFNFNRSDITRLDIMARMQGMTRTALVEDLIRAHIAAYEHSKFNAGEMDMSNESEFVGLRISQSERDLLARISSLSGQSVSGLIKRCIRQYFKIIAPREIAACKCGKLSKKAVCECRKLK